jgi:hypothetical protein
MPGPARQHVAFAEQQTLMQPGRRAVARMEKQIHFVAIRLLYQPRGLQLKHRQAAAGEAMRSV